MRALYQTRFGMMLINELDAYVGRSLMTYGDFSRGESQLFEDLIRPGMTVCDVGANIGAHTLHFARLVGPNGTVHAFEPQRLVFQMLCANMAINNIDNVFCHQEGIGDHEDVAYLGCMDLNQENNFGGVALEQLITPGGEPTRIRRLIEPCHFIKIDVEGMEREALLGAAEIIRAYHPILYVENDRADKSAALIEAIESLGYIPYWHVTTLFSEDNIKGVTENIFGGAASFNMVCMHKDTKHVGHNLDRAVCDHEQYVREKHGLSL